MMILSTSADALRDPYNVKKYQNNTGVSPYTVRNDCIDIHSFLARRNEPINDYQQTILTHRLCVSLDRPLSLWL